VGAVDFEQNLKDSFSQIPCQAKRSLRIYAEIFFARVQIDPADVQTITFEWSKNASDALSVNSSKIDMPLKEIIQA